MSKKKILIFVISAVIIIGGLILLLYLKQIQDYQAKVSGMTFSNIDISSVPDGKYIGESDVGFISVKAEVTVKDGKITAIDLLEHKNGRGAPAERIINEMVKEQTTDVDTVSGATNSSKVIRKAVENALLGSL